MSSSTSAATDVGEVGFIHVGARQGSEVADTVLGKLTVWRCAQEEADSDGTRSTTTLWFAPQLGMPVRTSGTTTLPSGRVMTLNTDLVKTTVPL